MARYVIGPDVAVRLAHDEAVIRGDHQILAPTLLRSQVRSLLYQAERRGDMTRRDAERQLDYLRTRLSNSNCGGQSISPAGPRPGSRSRPGSTTTTAAAALIAGHDVAGRPQAGPGRRQGRLRWARFSAAQYRPVLGAPAVRWQLPEKRDSMICQIEVSTLSGEPRPRSPRDTGGSDLHRRWSTRTGMTAVAQVARIRLYRAREDPCSASPVRVSSASPP
jgi:hypothetical protein